MSSSPTKAGPSSEAYTHNPFDYVPKLQPPPQDRPIPSHTNLEVQPHVNGPPPWPTITYRHLLSAGTLNPANPLRVIAHCDVDAAYAQFEASRLGLDATKVPIAVQQWQGLIAVNYPARDAGISRFESIPEALKKCPELRLVHVATYAHGSNQAGYHDDPKPETHKVSLDPYRKESNKILAIFKRTCPSGAVEKASIDESYFDLTVEVRKLMVERFPHLKQVPPDDAESGIKGMDRPLPPPPRIGLKQWQKLGHVIPKTGEVGKSTGIGRPDKEAAKAALLVDAPVGAGHVGVEGEVNGEAAAPPHASWGTDSVDGVTDPTSSQPEELSEEEALWDRLEYGETTWTDVALALGAELMNRVRANVVEELGYTTSAGIGSNKTLSKLCSSWRKPNGQTILRPCSVANFFAKLPFTRIRFLGGKLGTAMAQEWGEGAMVADLWSVSLEEMQAKFGEEARWVYNVLRGVDHSEVRERVNNQTMLASKSVRPPITRGEEAVHWLRILATELAVRLQEARNERTNLWPKTLVLRYIRAGSVPRSRQVAFPYFTWKDNEQLAAVVLKKGEKLWLECVGDALQGTVAGGGGRVLTIALGFSGLEEGEVGQRGIAAFLEGGTRSQKPTPTPLPPLPPATKTKREPAQDRPRETTPSSSTTTPTTPTRKKPKTTMTTTTTTTTTKLDDLFCRRPTADVVEPVPSNPSPSRSSPPALPPPSPSSSDEMPSWQCPDCATLLRPPPTSLAFERSYLLERLKEEHHDWHFALSLSQAPPPPSTPSSQSAAAASSRKQNRKRPRGLDKFFAKK